MPSSMLKSRKSFKIVEKRTAYIFITPCIVILLSIAIFPLVYFLTMSFRSYDLSAVYLGKPFIGLENYKEIIYDERFWNGVKNTFYLTGGALCGEFLLGLGIALLLNSIEKGKKFITSIIIMPIALAPVIVGYIWMLLYNVPYGQFNYVLEALFKISPPAWLSETEWALPGIIIVDIWQWTPFMALVFFAGIVSLPQGPYEAAKVDGASGLQTFAYITLPQMKKIMTIALIMRTMDLFKYVDKIFVLTGGGPGISTETITLYTYYMGFRHFRIGYASALSLFLLLIVTGLVIIFLKLFRSGE